MNVILIGPNGLESMKKVVGNMNGEVVLVKRTTLANGDYRWHRIVDGRKERIAAPVFNRDTKVIRWGNTITIRGETTIINSAKAVSDTSDKAKARQILAENNIPIPQTWFEGNDVPFGTKFIARPHHHKAGEDFFVVDSWESLGIFLETSNDIHEQFYYSEIYPKTHEYRVHVGHGKILGINEKPLVPGEIRANQAITGEAWGNVIGWNDYNKDLCKIACDAVKTLGLDMGAVDIMTSDTHEKPIVVCEVNTAPTIHDTEYLAERYAKYFDWLFRGNREWFDYTQWIKGKSFAWKNNHFEG